MTIFYSKFESLFENLRCTLSKCQSKSPLWSAVLLPLWVHLLPLCSLLTPLRPHVSRTWLACFHLSPLLAIPLVWYWHIFLPFFFQIFALRSPYQRDIPDHTFQLSIQFSHSVVSDSLRPNELQHARSPCPSPTLGVYSNSCPSSPWCHPAISSSVIPFSSCP